MVVLCTVFDLSKLFQQLFIAFFLDSTMYDVLAKVSLVVVVKIFQAVYVVYRVELVSR